MDVRLPRLGEGADSGTIASVFVKEGDAVKRDQPVLELESEKAVASIPAPADGVVAKLFVKEGDLIKVGQLIMNLQERSGSVQAAPAAKAAMAVEEAEPVQTPSPLPGPSRQTAQPVQVVREQVEGPQPAASPTVRKIARDLGIDLRRVRGSESGGRVVIEDVRAYVHWLQEKAFAGQASPSSAAVAAAPIDFSKWGPVEARKMSTLRTTISTRMVQSWTRVPHVTQFEEIDITKVLDLRKAYSTAFEKHGARLTLMPFALRAVVATLKKHPLFNASINEASGEVVYKQYYNIGIAVDTEHGLMVPVIRNVDGKSMLVLAREVQQLAEKARERKLSIEEMQGGSFSISNQGGIGGGFFTPIINAPEAAILGMGKSGVKPVVVDGRIEQRTLMPVGLSYDHRIIDGANAARFIVDLTTAFAQFPEDDLKSK
jgi:pyruvate dehydrogenase E2 component (dihydrolipoamide acetyltransferase)